MKSEFDVILKARDFITSAGIVKVPVDVNKYLAKIDAKLDIRYDLNNDEAGNTYSLNGRRIITVNGNHPQERQSFTALHEVAHVVLSLPSVHSDGLKIGVFGKRPVEEVLCDVFAAECLLPHGFFKLDANSGNISLDEVQRLSKKYEASLQATASRFATYRTDACAYALVEDGHIRYFSSSPSFREEVGYVDWGTKIANGSICAKLIANGQKSGAGSVLADVWVTKIRQPGLMLYEECANWPKYQQALCLLGLDDNSVDEDHRENSYKNEYERELLEELDGNLKWPSKRRRK